jgi:glycosyltransferase involved in cell wall biosynthesis
VGIKRQPVSIIVPTLNEAVNLPRLLKRIDDSLSENSVKYEVIIVDDKSIDKTEAVSKDLAKTYNIKFFTKVGPKGKAYSLLQGFSHASNELICMIDADLQYPPEAIAPMIDILTIEDLDIVLSKRIDRQVSLIRRLFSKVFNFVFVKLLFGINYDAQSGLKLFKKQVLNNMVISPSPWSFDLEFIVRSIESGYKITSFEIPFSKRIQGDAKINLITTAIELALASIRLRLNSTINLFSQGSRKRTENLKPSSRSFKLFVSVIAALAVCLAPLKVSALTVPSLDPSSLLQPVLTGLQSSSSQTTTNTGSQSIASSGSNQVNTTSPAATSNLPISTPLAASGSTKQTTNGSASGNIKESQIDPTTLIGAGTTSSNKSYYNDGSIKKTSLIKKLESIALISLLIGFVFLIAAASSIFLKKKKPLKEYRLFGYKAS